MNYVFVSKNKTRYEAFRRLLCSEDDEMYFSDEPLKLMADFVSGQIKAGMFLFEGDDFYPYKSFVQKILAASEFVVPVVFLDFESNHSNSRIIKWLFENELNYQKTNLHSYLPVFETVSKVSCLSAVKNPSSHSSAVLKTPSAVKSSLLSPSLEVSSQKKIYQRLSPVNRKIFEFFIKNQNRTVRIDEIADILHLNAEDETALSNSTYSYISRLRKNLTETGCFWELVRIGKGCYRMMRKN